MPLQPLLTHCASQDSPQYRAAPWACCSQKKAPVCVAREESRAVEGGLAPKAGGREERPGMREEVREELLLLPGRREAV
jgi:hypothetical protein